jgi:hypothetical protein
MKEMDKDLSFLSGAVAGFPGYGDDPDQRGTEQRVRALLGEALAELRARLGSGLECGLAERLDAAIFRCQFADQHRVAAVDRRKLHAEDVTLLAHGDREVVESVRGLSDLEPAALGVRLDGIMAMLDRRSTPFG